MGSLRAYDRQELCPRRELQPHPADVWVELHVRGLVFVEKLFHEGASSEIQVLGIPCLLCPRQGNFGPFASNSHENARSRSHELYYVAPTPSSKGDVLAFYLLQDIPPLFPSF